MAATTQSPLQLPPFFDMPVTQEGDKFSTDFYLYNDLVFQILNKIITTNGLVFPSFTTAETLAFPDGVSIGTTWYNSDLDKLQFKGATAIQTITST